jgi:hypothetical protein
MARRRRGVLGFAQDFMDGYTLGNKIAGAIGMVKAGNAGPETIESQKLGVETTPGTDGAVYDSDTGQYLPKYMDGGKPTEQAQAQQNATQDEPSRAPEGVTPTFATETTTQYRMGGKTQDQPFTADQIWKHRVNELGDVSMRYGNPQQAAQFMGLAARRQEADDQSEIRKILAGDKPDSAGPVPVGSPDLSTVQGAPATAGTAAGKQEVPVATAEAQLGGSAQQPQGLQKQRSYLDVVGPRVMDAYLKQGKVAEAKAWRDFTESEGGHAYANDFAQAQRLVTAGDFDTAAPVLEKLYNRGYPDGRQAKLTSLGDGNFKLDVFDQKTGQQLGSKTMPAVDMGKMAIGALAPTKLVEFMAQQHGKREAEGATLNKSLELERLRQEGADVRDDRREERLQTRLDSQTANLERRISTQGGRSGLTAAQQRSNAEIDAAREAIAGLSPQDINHRTAKTSNTGRINEDYDPGLARQAALAGRRKIGDDEMFDTPKPKGADVFAGKPLADMTDGQLQQFARSAGQGGKAKIDAELARRTLAGIPQMQGHQIGQYVEGKGYQVLDPQGRPVSYLRKKAQ